ncbi:DNA/RNA nuclease SfsA [Alkalibacter rhizosphaerae]|uniref:Sugar fermentation stimulation protein homolog n=1 Tax=Alkalibacter rhizosphaerae TaxID=2815577 RepID=A0A974XFG5_9FIRM|nr:DNA/RNA nuclease SfsA [Alkalibacter rhizosphaerae]QSX08848.1 DNA/RNA nuclease SfsA [Alkalibacter rhizosphaerae]
MKYGRIIKGHFIKRPNRFIARVGVGEQEEIAHVKNTGRCAELLLEDSIVYLEEATNPNRKTKFSLIAVEKKGNDGKYILVNMDSQVPNSVVEEGLKEGSIPEIGEVTFYKREATVGRSRFDFYCETKEAKGYIEVKGVTLEEDGVARFPDAPTERGRKHLNELKELQMEGYRNFVFFLIQMKGPIRFEPNDETDPKFGEALRHARNMGVEILCYDTLVARDAIVLDRPIPIQL